MPKPLALTSKQIEQVAVLLAQEEMTQTEIAKLMNVAPATINRAVQKAIKTGLLVRKLEITDRVSKRNLSIMRTMHKATPVQEALKTLEAMNGKTKHFRELHVFDSGGPKKSNEERIFNFAKAAAGYLSKQLMAGNVKNFGVSWGIALLNLLDALRIAMPNFPRQADPVMCVPLAGSPPDAEQFNKTSSANLAGAYSRMLNGPAGETSSFSVAGWIPAQIQDKEISIIKRYAFSSPSYKNVFSEKGLIHELDCILTSIGAINDFSGPWLKTAANAANLSIEAFSKLTIGNISGCFLSAPKLKSAESKILENVNARWLGIQLDQLWKCAKRANERNIPGVIIIAIGEGKAEIVVEAIKRGLVSTVLCDIPLLNRLQVSFAEEVKQFERDMNKSIESK